MCNDASIVKSEQFSIDIDGYRCTMLALELVQQYLEHVEEQEREYEPE